MLISDLGPHDILLGRGTGPNENPGNRFFRNLISEHCNGYMSARNRKEKDRVVQTVLGVLRKENGRFVQKVSSSGDACARPMYKVLEDRGAIRLKAQLAFRYAINGSNGTSGASDSSTYGSDNEKENVHARRVPVPRPAKRPKTQTPLETLLDLTEGGEPADAQRELDSLARLPPKKRRAQTVARRAPIEQLTSQFSPIRGGTTNSAPGLRASDTNTKSPYHGLDVLAQAGAVLASQEKASRSRAESNSPTDLASIWKVQHRNADFDWKWMSPESPTPVWGNEHSPSVTMV